MPIDLQDNKVKVYVTEYYFVLCTETFNHYWNRDTAMNYLIPLLEVVANPITRLISHL